MGQPITSWTPGQGGNGSLTVNGQILPVPMSGQFFPTSAASPYYAGNGQPPPTVPLSYIGSAGSGGAANQTAANIAASNPFSFVQSPLIIALAALVVGILGLRFVHWR